MLSPLQLCIRTLSGTPPVITLDRSDFERDCQILSDTITASGFKPDYIVAIASGGLPVSNRIRLAFPESKLLEVTKRRPTTAVKEANGQLLKRIMKRLPYYATDLLRRAEHWSRYTERDFNVDPVEVPPKELVVPEIDLLSIPSSARILIVDDAIDTGTTIEFVTSLFRRHSNHFFIKTAAITVTAVNPYAKSDYFVYYGTNIRFYWSGDFR